MNAIEEHIENIEKNIMEYQRKNGFDTVFDFMTEDLASIKALVKDYDCSQIVINSDKAKINEVIHIENFKGNITM